MTSRERTAKLTDDALNAERESVLHHLVGMPASGHATVTREVLRAILLSTGGQMILGGGLYEITSKHLGAGIYRVSTKRATEPEVL